MIRQSNLMRPGEKRALKILKLLNQIGILKSQKPISVTDLAQKMINEIKSGKTVRLQTFLSQEIFFKNISELEIEFISRIILIFLINFYG